MCLHCLDPSNQDKKIQLTETCTGQMSVEEVISAATDECKSSNFTKTSFAVLSKGITGLDPSKSTLSWIIHPDNNNLKKDVIITVKII